jgi:hypothetical protein
MAIKLSYNPSTIINLVILINNLNILSNTKEQDTKEEAIKGKATKGEDSEEEE